MAKLDTASINAGLAELEFNWKLKGSSLVLQLQTKDFSEAIWLFEQIAKAAETLNHHPDLNLQGYNNVTITLSTHSAGGVTSKDLALAERVDAIITRING